MKIKSVKICGYNKIPANRQEEQPSNGCGKEQATYLVIEWDDGAIQIQSDAMEPEDCRFYRNLSWVKRTLEKTMKKS